MLLYCLLMLIRSNAQVYNYDPIRYTNFETNPSYLSSDKYRRTATYLHQGHLVSSGKFSCDELKISAYSRRLFTGAGLVLNHTVVNDSTQYSYIGAGLAYRTTLFDKIRARAGIFYKLNSIRSSAGSFEYYGFRSSAEGISSGNKLQNANLSLSFSSPRDRYFLSLAMLNVFLVKQAVADKILFPAYYTISIGDLAKVFDRQNAELYYTGFATQYAGRKKMLFSHYINVLNVLNFTRYSSVRYGLRAGYAEESYAHCTPVLSYYMRTEKKNFWNYQLLYDFAIPLKNKQRIFKPSLQISLTCMF
ncbi:MAG: hypothetical protein K0S33_1792 [Bacteroidetes bacterium]|nr:hypothetical protein [Bacteroidota bacterium]